MNSNDIHIPTTPKVWPLPMRSMPITPRENLMLALNHQKPVWMPDLYASSQVFLSMCTRDAEDSLRAQPDLLGDIAAWESQITWPDLARYDWAADSAQLMCSPSLALFMPMYTGPFERLVTLLGFEQALTSLITEPEAVREFFVRLVDFKIELFSRIRDHVPLDYIVAADDWGTARAPFFSAETFARTLLEPTARFAKAVRARGTKFIAHSCGKIDGLIPCLVEEVGVDGLEIQDINDIDSILKKYGARVTVEVTPDRRLVHDPQTTGEQIRAHAREIVDRLGAQATPGSGVVLNIGSSHAHIFYPMEDEFYNYSLSQYAGLTR